MPLIGLTWGILSGIRFKTNRVSIYIHPAKHWKCELSDSSVSQAKTLFSILKLKQILIYDCSTFFLQLTSRMGLALGLTL